MSRSDQVITELASAPPPLLTLVIPLNPFGTTSSTETPVASLGPSLLTVIVNVTVSPTLGSGLSTNLIKLISTDGLKPKSTVILPLSSSAAS